MSILSAQCERLRERAKELRNLAPDPDVPYLVPSTKETMALAMKSAASEMEGAANTVWELRNKLADMVDERETSERNRVRNAREYARLCHENDKLRELVADMADELCALGIDFKRIGWCDYADRMRELGVEL